MRAAEWLEPAAATLTDERELVADGELRYAGKVGTGFDRTTLENLGSRLWRIERESCPLAETPKGLPRAHWVRPELVAEIGFTEWTGAGRLRHPRFLGLRKDKTASDVVRERGAG